MASVTECLEQIQKLTQQNLQILKGLNDSFFTKSLHTSLEVGDEKFTIPSFLSLENKINSLESNFLNLVNAPKTGEAFFNFDGNSQAIEVRGFTSVPSRLTLNQPTSFGVLQNDIFKDFLTPVPYVNFLLTSLPNDIVSVNVKKIIPSTDALKEIFKSNIGQITYADVIKILNNYVHDEDYVEYDTVMSMPIRKNIGSATYVIKTITEDKIDKSLDEYITVQLRNDMSSLEYTNTLTYKLFDETIEKDLTVGDYLVTYDDSAKLEIVEISTATSTLKLRVLNGDYLNLFEYPTGSTPSDHSKLKFFSPVRFDDDKNIKVPLEEDQYVFIAIAALNSRMNVQSPWGSGVIIDTYTLKNQSGTDFKTYYDQYVRNVGDILFEISSTMTSTLMSHNSEEFKSMTEIKPIPNTDDISVVRINTHLDMSPTIQNIRSLYSQKKQKETELSEVQSQINNINNELARISFDDTTGIRTTYQAQLSEYDSKKSTLTTAITKLIDEIAAAANASEVPIENAKYRIRGFYDFKELEDRLSIVKDHIKAIQIQYRYKSPSSDQGTAHTMTKEFIFSDWNDMSSFSRKQIPTYNSGYKFNLEPYNGDINEPSFNQIDIPITQGETVDIRTRVIYDFGQPFVSVRSAWSDVINIAFPEELTKDVKILDIISENNDDIETNRFNNILASGGTTEHVNDKLVDQDITYYHKPESIASGFYTTERRIIPLKDKLTDMSNAIVELQDIISGSSNNDLIVSIMNNNSTNTIYPDQENNIYVSAYNDVDIDTNDYKNTDGIATTTLNLNLTNNSDHTIKLYSVFPGSRDKKINELVNTKYPITNYCEGASKGVFYAYYDSGSLKKHLQTANQYITFRINDAYDSTPYYKEFASYSEFMSNNKLANNEDFVIMTGRTDAGLAGAAMYPLIKDRHALCINSDNTRSYITLNPGESIIIPIIYEYKFTDSQPEDSSWTKTMTFDIRTSLYQDPTNYLFTVISPKSSTMQSKVLISNSQNNGTAVKYNDIISNSSNK